MSGTEFLLFGPASRTESLPLRVSVVSSPWSVCICQLSVVSCQLQRGDAESRASLTAASGLGPKASGASPGLLAGLYDAAPFVAKPISNVAAWQFFRSTWGNDPLAMNLRPGGGGCPGGSSARRRLNPGETSWTDIPVENASAVFSNQSPGAKAAGCCRDDPDFAVPCLAAALALALVLRCLRVLLFKTCLHRAGQALRFRQRAGPHGN